MDLSIDIIEQDIANLDMELFETLLSDRTTGRYIVWGTDNYASLGERYAPDRQILPELVLGSRTKVIQPRVSKSLEEQQDRTRKKAEVFTPSWICNRMNNHCDEEWFSREGVFNAEDGEGWIVNPEKVAFEKTDGWKSYVDSRRLEITCGEAPYLASRYDASSGEAISVPERIGILDRKLRVVGENTANMEEWLEWTIRAYQATYGFEFQGDSLLIARINLLATFIEYMQDRWGESPSIQQLREIADVISWNLWQMDGLTGTVPFEKMPERKDPQEQMSFFDLGFDGFSSENDEKQRRLFDLDDEEKGDSIDDCLNCIECKIYDWINGEEVCFNDIKRG